MKLILKASIAALILVLGGTTVKTYAQRCGGDLTYFLRNTKGEIIDEEKIDLRYVQNSGAYYPKDLITFTGGQVLGSVYLGRYGIDQTVINPEKRSEHTDWVKILRFTTACGKSLIEIELEHENQIMLIRFLNIPAETNFFVYARWRRTNPVTSVSSVAFVPRITPRTSGDTAERDVSDEEAVRKISSYDRNL